MWLLSRSITVIAAVSPSSCRSRFAASVPPVPPPRMTILLLMISVFIWASRPFHGQRSPGHGRMAWPVRRRPGGGPRLSARAFPAGLQPGADDGGEVGQAAGVAPFVVVPAEHLDQDTRGLRQARVEHAGGRVTDDVAGDQGVGAVAQHPGQAVLGRGREGAVDL